MYVRAMTDQAGKPSNSPDPRPPVSPSRRRFLKRALGVAAAGAVVAAVPGVDTDDLTLEDHKVTIAGWPKSAAGMKIGHLSDFHVDCADALARTHRSVAMLLAQKPDVVFLTGDFVTYKPNRWAHVAAAALAPLANVPCG